MAVSRRAREAPAPPQGRVPGDGGRAAQAAEGLPALAGARAAVAQGPVSFPAATPMQLAVLAYLWRERPGVSVREHLRSVYGAEVEGPCFTQFMRRMVAPGWIESRTVVSPVNPRRSKAWRILA